MKKCTNKTPLKMFSFGNINRKCFFVVREEGHPDFSPFIPVAVIPLVDITEEKRQALKTLGIKL